MTERLQKILSARGVASRRKAEELIAAGRVTCNGRVCALGDSADTDLAGTGRVTNFTFYDNLGALKAGNAADFIAVDYCDPTPLNEHNLFSHLTSNFSGNVDTVVVNGKVLKKDRRLTTVDKEEVFAKCREHAERLWNMI